MHMVNNKSPLDSCDSAMNKEIDRYEGARELLEVCFSRPKSERPTAAKLLEHPFFASLD